MALTFRQFIRVLSDHGFRLDRQRGSHRVYVGVAGGKVRVVVVAFHREGDIIRPGTLASMIRQSGLGKDAFR